MTTASDLVREARSKAGVSQVELAAAAELSQSVVSAYERGRREPSMTMLRKLVEAAGCELRVDVVYAPIEVVVAPPLRPWIEKLAPDIKAVAQRHGYENVRLFGSVVRGEDRPNSDVDLLVDGHRGLLDLAGCTNELEALLGRPVDIVPSHALKDDIASSALAEAVPL